jgi:ParB/RepB/Spo0J family partition protein
MAVQWATKCNSTQEWRFLPEDIVIPSHLNGRHVLPEIDWLIEDILANGQHTPVVIRKDGGKPVLCAGFSRYRAVSEINKRKLSPVPLQLRCTYSQSDEKEGFLLAISENHMRNSLTDLDYAYNIKLLMKKFGMLEEQVALVYFPSSDGKASKEALKFVRQKVALIDLSKEAEKALIEGRLKGSAARAIAKLSNEQQKELIEKAGPYGPIKLSKGKKSPNFKKAVARVVETGKLDFQGKHLEVPDLIVDWLQSFFPLKQTKIADAEAEG